MGLYIYLKRDIFEYTGEDQHWTCPETGTYRIECYGAGAKNGKGGYTSGEFEITEGATFSVVVGQSGSNSNSSTGTYGFGGGRSTQTGYPTGSCGGGLSGVFTGDTEVGPDDAERALIIAGGAGGGVGGARLGGNGGGLTGGTGGGTNYGTAGGGGTQTGHGSTGNASMYQFSGGQGTQKYGYGGGGGRWGGNGAIGDTSGDDDKGAGGGSGYVKDIASNPVLTQGGGALEGDNGKVLITKIS